MNEHFFFDNALVVITAEEHINKLIDAANYFLPPLFHLLHRISRGSHKKQTNMIFGKDILAIFFRFHLHRCYLQVSRVS